MKLRYLGHSCFQCIAENGLTVLTDPYTKIGYELPDGVCADLVLCSHEHFDHCFLQGVKNISVVKKDAGEAEYGGVRIKGIETAHDDKNGALRGKNTVFKFWLDGISFCHLGDLGEPLSSSLLQEIGEVDVLMIPIGGTYTIDAHQAKEYVERIAPKVVVPMHFKPQDGILDIASPCTFLHLFEEEKIVKISGEVEICTETILKLSGKILYMERVKEL